MKALTLAAIILVSAALSGRNAVARTFRFHGTICYHTASNFSTDYSQYGITNIGSFPVVIECPLPLSSPTGAPSALTRVDAMVADRNATPSNDISCQLEEVNKNGAVLVSLPSSEGGGGFTAPVIDLPFFPPAGADTSGYWRVRCTIPGIASNAGNPPVPISKISLLSSIVVNTTE